LGVEGRLVVVGFASGGPPPTVAANHLLVRNLDVIGVAWPAYRTHRPDLVSAAQRHINEGLASGAYRALIAGVRPLSQAGDALADLRSGTTVGKWVLTPDQPPPSA
jgi:NADPH2:quinone reductase